MVFQTAMKNSEQGGRVSKDLPMASGRATTELYSHSFWDPELKKSRTSLISTLILPILYLSISMWAVLSLYWGSTTYSSLNGLSVQVTNLDNGHFGTQVLSAIQESSTSPDDHINWVFRNESSSDQVSRDMVINEVAWAVVQGRTSMCFWSVLC